MNKIIRNSRRLARDEAGTSTLEYALVSGLIIVGCIGAIALMGDKVKSGWTYISGYSF